RQRLLQSHNRDNISGTGRIDYFPLRGVHLEYPRNVLAPVTAGIKNPAARFQSPLVNPQEVQITMHIAGYLEHKRYQRRLPVTLDSDLVLRVPRFVSDNIGFIKR